MKSPLLFIVALLVISLLPNAVDAAVYDSALATRMHGRILLQVEEHGEAWYVRAKDSNRYYMKDGAAAYSIMRFFSQGITDADLAKIPSVANTTAMKASSSACASNALANRMRGEILLQVQQHGEAWYVDPVKCRAIYMKDGAVAYEAMRFLGLGILNRDLTKIEDGGTVAGSGESTTTLPIEPDAKALSFSWEKDSGSRITDGSVPYIYKMKDGTSRLYYCNSQGILSAISSDGTTFAKEQGVRISPGEGFERIVCDPTIVDLPDGRIRMYYKGADSMNAGPGQSVHKIFSAVSSDGLTFQKEGLRIDSETNGDNGWASVPDAITLPDGRVRLYYVTAAEMQHGIGSAISSDGLNFVKEPGIRVPDLVDPALVKIGDTYLLFAASIDEQFAKVPKGIYYLESSDGLHFDNPIAVFQTNDVYDPSVLKIDDRTVRVFYGKVVPPQLPAVESHIGRIIE